ncbi:O-Antigen ligase [Pseudooceanicola marinus]|uniref:O-Antigen ligase n=1 Tax=Pseudooceanicola marinus TaxID=396013 RepID=A0A1X7AAT3_9RHOB|nr:O-antigen ligase family protein [Pseudooceanicola marinus]SLN74399.1 O-Antigen ligase [Pseudooceanicola marinus]
MKISISRSITVLMAIVAGLALAGMDFNVGLRLRIGDFFLLMAIPLAALAYMRSRQRYDIFPVLAALGIYIAYMVFNALLLTGKGVAIKEGIQACIFYIGAAAAYVLALRDDDAFRRFTRVFFVLLWAVALYGVYWHVSRGMFSGWKELGEQKLSFGFLLVIVVGLSHPAMLTGKKQVLLLLGALALILLSGERKGWIAAALACFAMMTVSGRGYVSKRMLNRLVVFLAGGLVVILVTTLIAPAFPYLNRQLSSIGEFIGGLFGGENLDASTQSNQERVFILRFGMELFRSNPVFGAGLERFQSLIALLPGNTIVHGAHNEILRIAAELGTVGLVLYLSVYAVVLLRLRQALAVGARLSSLQQLRLRLGAGVLTYGFVVNFFLVNGGPSIFFLVFPIGLVYSVPLPRRQPAARSAGATAGVTVP